MVYSVGPVLLLLFWSWHSNPGRLVPRETHARQGSFLTEPGEPLFISAGPSVTAPVETFVDAGT